MTDRPLIVITNDDGIASPGLAAAAAAMASLGDLLIVAPAKQQSGTGRSMPGHNDGRLTRHTITFDGQSWPGYGANASPAQAVQHAVLELADRTPALLVSGINYGENVGTAVTISGTVGAALEAAAHGIRSIAISLQTDPSLHHSYDESVNFRPAGHFARRFAERWLASDLPADIDVLKIEVPAVATVKTPWEIARLERNPYFVPVPGKRASLDAEGRIGYKLAPHGPSADDTDVAVLLRAHVAVTPLSLDMTSRVDPGELGTMLR